MEIRKIRPADAEKFVEFYEKLVKESDYLMFTPKETAEKAKQEQKYIEDYDDYKQVFVATEGERIVGYLGHFPQSFVQTEAYRPVYRRRAARQSAAGNCRQADRFCRKLGEGKGRRPAGNYGGYRQSSGNCLFEKHHYEREGIRKKAVSFDDKYADEYFMAKVI